MINLYRQDPGPDPEGQPPYPDSQHWAGIFKPTIYGAGNRVGIWLSSGPPGYIGWRNWFLGIDSWAHHGLEARVELYQERRLQCHCQDSFLNHRAVHVIVLKKKNSVLHSGKTAIFFPFDWLKVREKLTSVFFLNNNLLNFFNFGTLEYARRK